VELIAQPLAVDGEDGEVVRGVGGHHDPLPAQTERGGRRQLGSSLECPEQISKGCVHKKRSVLRPADDESQLGRDHRARDCVLVACEDRSWGRHLSFTNYSLRSGIPVPQEHRTILRARHNVAVTRIVTLTPCKASDNAIVTEDDLRDLGGLR